MNIDTAVSTKVITASPFIIVFATDNPHSCSKYFAFKQITNLEAYNQTNQSIHKKKY